MRISTAITLPLKILLLISILLPSGEIYDLNVKVIASAATYLAIVAGTVHKRRILQPHFSFALAFFSFLLIFSLIAINNQTEKADIFSHVSAFFALFTLVFTTSYFTTLKYINYLTVLRLLISGLVLLSLVKITISTSVFFGTNPQDIKATIEDIFRTSFIGLDTGIFYRIHLPSDYLLPLATFLLLQSKTTIDLFKPTQKKIIVTLLIASSILSYSRYLYVYCLLAIALPYIYSDERLRTRTTLVTILLLAIAFTLIATGSQISDFVSERYFGEHAGSSDATRRLMLTAILETFYANPFFGVGLGASATAFTNIADLPWYFELQWLSFGMHFGLIGLALLVTAATAPLVQYARMTPRYFYRGVILLYLLWLSVGIFNGFMLTSSGGAIFAAFYALIHRNIKG